MRRLTAALAAIICVTLTGCSGDSDNSPSGNTELESFSPPSVTEPITSSEEDGADSLSEELPPEQTEKPVTEESYPVESATEPPQTEKAPPADITKQIAAFDNTFLGLPSADKVYIFSDAYKSAEIDGYLCYAVSCYDEHEGTLYYMCDFYISPDGSRVYRYYEQEERFAILPEEQMTRLDPTRQSVDEIFSAAETLYSMFHPYRNSYVDGIDHDTATTEINGEEYRPVTGGQINSKAALLDALDRYFSNEIVTALMDTNKFIELDGMLYVRIGNISGPSFDPTVTEIEHELTELTENTCDFTKYVTHQYEAGETEVKEYVYRAEKQNGVWRFTDFTAPWNVYGPLINPYG